MPIYEFSCASCGERFEELVGSHVGVELGEVRCRSCHGAQVTRLTVSTYAPIHRQPTAAQRRRRDDARGVDRGGAAQRFAERRAAARRRFGAGDGA